MKFRDPTLKHVYMCIYLGAILEVSWTSYYYLKNHTHAEDKTT